MPRVCVGILGATTKEPVEILDSSDKKDEERIDVTQQLTIEAPTI
jgi:hypothetical protein